MRFRQIIGLGVACVFLLFLTGTYVAYSQQKELFETRGAYYVQAEGKVYFTGGKVYAVIQTFKAWFDKSPSIPTYSQYLGDMFDFGKSKPASVPSNYTFVTLEVQITVSADRMASKKLLDDSQRIPYLWAGGSIGSNGEIGSFSYTLGPYVAYHEFSPYKFTCQADVGASKVLETYYLTIPDLSKQTSAQAKIAGS